MKRVLNILGVLSFALCMGVIFGAASQYIAPQFSSVVTIGTTALFSFGGYLVDLQPGIFAVGGFVASGGNQLRDVYNKMRSSYPKCTVTYSYLRSEVDLSASQGPIRFPVLVNDSAPNVNERRLNIGDAFQVTSIGFLLYKTASGGNRDGQQLVTYPNPVTFSKSGESGALTSLYNGSLSITVDRKELIPSMDCLQFYRVPVAQKGVLTAATGTNNAYALDGFPEDWGLTEIIPTIRLSGAVVNDIVLSPSVGRDMTGTSSTNTAVLFMRGFLIQGGAQFNDKASS